MKGIEDKDFRQMGEHGIFAVCGYSHEPAVRCLELSYSVTISVPARIALHGLGEVLISLD